MKHHLTALTHNMLCMLLVRYVCSSLSVCNTTVEMLTAEYLMSLWCSVTVCYKTKS